MRDRGAASIYAAAIGTVLALTGLAVAVRGIAIVASAQARNAADLGALAGARFAAFGAEVACGRAREIVAANAAEMSACDLEGLEVTVTALVRGRSAAARAGPIR